VNKVKVADIDPSAADHIPPKQPDSSGIGVNFVDRHIKVLNVTLPDGRAVSCKRLGLEIQLQVGSVKGAALMHRQAHGPDVKVILAQALHGAAAAAGVSLTEADGAFYLGEAEST